MSAGPWAYAGSTAARSALYMAKAQAGAQMRQRAMELSLDMYRPSVKPTPAKCACCGSHEFRKHAGRMICSYCRTDGR